MQDSLLLSLVLFFPLGFFYYLFKKSWVDADLHRALAAGLALGVVAIFITRLVYVPVELYLGTDLRSFISGPRSWWVTLLTSIAIIGFVEEALKAAGGLIATANTSIMRRPTVIFMSFAGCALSFSLIENFQYYLVFGAAVVLPRIIISSTAHLFFACISSVIAAIALSRSRAESIISARILFGIVVSAVAHGFFDFLLFHFDIQALSGVIASLVSLFLLGIYEAWISVLRIDQLEGPSLNVCSGCGAFSLDCSRFCGFCGERVLRKHSEFSLKVTD